MVAILKLHEFMIMFFQVKCSAVHALSTLLYMYGYAQYRVMLSKVVVGSYLTIGLIVILFAYVLGYSYISSYTIMLHA